MRFYPKEHKHYCGIGLHAKSMYLCIVDNERKVLLHRNIKTDREVFLRAVIKYREDLVVAVEWTFTWYWIADLWEKEGISFALGHTLYMKAIHGGKAKNDRMAGHIGQS